MNVVDLFPIPLGVHIKEKCFTKKEEEFILALPTKSNTGNFSSQNSYVLDEPELAKLKAYCTNAVKDYFEMVYKPVKKTEIYITQSWVNFTTKGQYHHKHAHPNSYISGVLYIKADKDTDKIHFFRNKYNQLHVNSGDFNPWNSESWYMNAEKYELLLFPSSTEHMVTYVESEETRVSLSFNTFLRGDLGMEDSLSEVRLG
jgi:uncharacterized protein (TIGR02466 family)